MPTKVKIALNEPGMELSNRYFSLRLKQALYTEPSEYDKPERMLIISDIKGDFKSFRSLLLDNGVIDRRYKWTFEDGHVVIVGNSFSEGSQVAECLWFIYALEEKAHIAGGYVHFILGSHDIMNLNGDWTYMQPKYANNAKTSRTPYAILYDGNRELWRWLKTKNILEKIGDVLIVHESIAGNLNLIDLPINQLNRIARRYYTQAAEPLTEPLLQDTSASNPSVFDAEQLNNILIKFDIRAIVTAHATSNHSTLSLNGKEIAKGGSKWETRALLIRKDRFLRIHAAGKREGIK